MIYFTLFLFLLIILYLLYENCLAIKNQKKFKHIIHVNGTRGKSTVTRLIDSGVRAGGYKTFCKTTGTLPTYINTKNEEVLIDRRGPANIKEQLVILNKASKEDADILIIECMAVDPELQYISQHKMLKADIGVITNVRLDHTDVMGDSLEEICDSLSNTIPKNGVLFTGDKSFYKEMQAKANKLGSKAYLSSGKYDLKGYKFPENYEIALDVCQYLGIDKSLALQGMKNYKHDPYDLTVYKLDKGGIFINGLSINDPTSIELVYEELKDKLDLYNREFTLLINNRPDRGFRAKQMIEVANKLEPDKVLLTGSFANIMKRNITCENIEVIKNPNNINLDIDSKTYIFAIGNIANHGQEIIEKVAREVDIIVR